MLIEKPAHSASKRHKLLYEIFTSSSFFSNYVIKQEVPIRDLVPGYATGRHRADWFIQDLGIVIEVMGEQHSNLVRFGNISKELALTNLINTRTRDSMKKNALEEEGYTYIEIKYDEELSESSLMTKINKAIGATSTSGAAEEQIIERQVTRARSDITRNRRHNS